MRKTLLLATLSLVALSLVVPSAYGALRIVDCTGPTAPPFQFSDLTTALSFTLSGDTLLIRPCIYNENILIQNLDNVHLVAAQYPGSPGLTGSQRVGVGPQSPSPVVIDGIGLPDSCVRITDSRGVALIGLEIRRCAQHGVEIFPTAFPTSDIRLHANLIRRTTRSAILVQGAERAKIVGNRILESLSSSGIVIGQARQTLVADNSIGAHVDHGVEVSLGSFRTHLVNNDVRNNLANGILDQGAESRIERNRCWNNSAVNLDVQGTNGDVVGNDTAGSFVFAGVGNEFSNNL